MKKLFLPILTLVLGLITICACTKANGADQKNKTTMDSTATTAPQPATPGPDDVKVLVETTAGNFEILLYGDTPKHQQNFVKLVNEGYYNGTLFHRVIKDFMVQAGDPDSRTAKPGQQLGSGDPGYTLEAEILYPKHFHKRYALAAARTGDAVNPERRSSGSQFYVVTGNKYTATSLERMQNQAIQKQQYELFNRLASENRKEIARMQQEGDTAGLEALRLQLIAKVEASTDSTGMTEAQKQAYSTIGGAPHLDGQYTVFGEVISGFDTIDKIENVKTAPGDRPVEDVRITGMKIIK